MSKYQQGKIYKIVCDKTDLVYYGSTIDKLGKRFQHHKCNHKRNKKHASQILLEMGECKIELVEYFPCNSKKELLERENYYIENNKCCNYRLSYVKDMRERRKVHDKKHYEKYREKYLKKFEEYRTENKEKLYARAGQKIECADCGRFVRRGDIARHKKSKVHLDSLTTNNANSQIPQTTS